MSFSTVLLKSLGVPLGKFLLKRYLSDPAEGVGEALLDLAQTRISEYSDQRKAQRQFEDLGERIAARLVPLFEEEGRYEEFSIPAVAWELAHTLNGHISADFFIAEALDPAQLAAALRQARPMNEVQFSASEVALYNRALDEAVRYLVQVASRLPQFEEAYAAASLQHLGRLGDDLEEVLNTTRRIEQTVTRLAAQNKDADEQFARFEADYRQAVMRNLDYLELFGADILPESRRHALSVAYISLNLKKPAAKGEESQSLPVTAVLDSLRLAGRLLVRGEAGSGKSTLSRWTAIQSASFEFMSQPPPPRRNWLADAILPIDRKASPAEGGGHAEVPGGRRMPGVLPDMPSKTSASGPAEGDTEEAKEKSRPSADWRMRIPFLLRLRDCKEGQLPVPDDFPAHIATEIGNPPPNWVASILRQGKAIILLDGIDEVPNIHREQLRRAIEGIVRAYPDNYFVASTRPTAVEEEWLAQAGFREATVDPMSEVDRTLFIERWHDAVGRELTRLGRPDPALTHIAAELIEQIPEYPPVARLATNPLLCAMVCALHRERNRKLPESQSELCEAICHMLLHRRERESGLSMEAFPEAYRALTYHEKRAIVQDVAHYMVRNGESTIEWERARQSVQDSLRQFSDRKGIDAAELLKLLIERSGMLRETRPRELDFIHNTIKEFLAAERFADAGDAGQLADRFADGSWQPVILFSVATNRREFATRVVQRILHSHEPNESMAGEEMRARRLFALRCRAAALHLSPELTAELGRIVGSLFPPRSMGDAVALASGGDTVVDYLRYRKRLSDLEAAASVRTLRLIGTHKAEKALRGYLNDSRISVVSELAQALNPLEIVVVRTMVQTRSATPAAIRAQITDLAPLRDLDLSSLDLADTRITDLRPLAGLTGLQSLDLGDTQVTDLTPLAGLTGLQSLNLWNTRVKDIAPLAGLTELHSLVLWSTNVDDLAPLVGFTRLRALDLRFTRVSNLAPLAGLTNLQTLDLRETRVNDLAPLAGLASLRALDLARTRVADLTPLRGLTGLRVLDLRGTNVTDLEPLVDVDLNQLILGEAHHVSTLMLKGKPRLKIHWM
jgi:hypothetical protein